VMNLVDEGRLRLLLDAAEDASPVQAVEAVTRALGRAVDATSVSFLIADLSGRARSVGPCRARRRSDLRCTAGG
jgi:hypothetical protein